MKNCGKKLITKMRTSNAWGDFVEKAPAARVIRPQECYERNFNGNVLAVKGFGGVLKAASPPLYIEQEPGKVRGRQLYLGPGRSAPQDDDVSDAYSRSEETRC